MAEEKMADIQELMPQVHEELIDAIADLKYDKILALAEQVPIERDMDESRNMRKYYGVETRPPGAYGPFTEASNTLHSPRAGDAFEPYMDPVAMTGTLAWSQQDKDMIERSTFKGGMKKLGKRMITFAKQIRHINAKLFLGRGDGVVARANAAATNDSTFEAAPTGPFMVTRGMWVRSFGCSTAETNEERLKQDSDTGTGYLGDTPAQIMQIRSEGDTPSFTLSGASAWADDAVLVIADGSTNAFPSGLQNHLDAPTADSSMVWDAEDGTSTDHTDTYLGRARSSYPDLECQTYDAGTAAIDDQLVAEAVARSLDQGADISNLVALANPRQTRKFQRTFQGGLRFTPGQKIKQAVTAIDTVSVLSGADYGDLKWISEHGIPDGKLVILDKSRLKQFKIEGKWLKGSDGYLFLQPSGGSGHKATWLAYIVMYWNSGLFLPGTSTVAYSLAV